MQTVLSARCCAPAAPVPRARAGRAPAARAPAPAAAPPRPAAARPGRRRLAVAAFRASGPNGADYYSTLGVDRGADKKAVKKAYRDLARKFHPVRCPGVEGLYS
jgi:hypothetical protein